MDPIANKTEFCALPADDRASILLRFGAATNAVAAYRKDNPGIVLSDTFKPLVEHELKPRGLNELADQLWQAALVFDKNSPYPNVQGARLEQLQRVLGQVESQLVRWHSTAPYDNATPCDDAHRYGIRAVLGNEDRWRKINNKSVSDDDMKSLVRTMHDFLGKLPLHERYGLHMAQARNHRNLMPPIAHDNLRSHVQSPLIKAMVARLMPLPLLEVPPLDNALWKEFTDHQQFKDPISPPGQQR